jgi:protein O-mannosyl-transferase
MSGEKSVSSAAPTPFTIRALGVALAFIVVAAYATSFGGTWVYDDVPSIVHNAAIRHLGTAFAPASDGLPIAGRPLVSFSLALNYALSGTATWGYHLTNLAIHGAATLLLFGLVRRTLLGFGSGGGESGPTGIPGQRQVAAIGACGEAPTALAFVAALGWAVHPLQTEAVVYVVQRAESLMALFYLLTLYTFVRGLAAATRRRWWFGASIVACASGMATKEVMVSAPLLVLLYDRAWVSGNLACAWRARRRYYLGLAATWLVLLGLVLESGTRGGTAGFAGKVGPLGYALVQLRAHIVYFRLALWPHPLVFDYGVDRLPLQGAEWACGVVVAVAVAIILWRLWQNSAAGLLGFAYCAILAPSSSVVPVVTEMMAEHRLYLPLAALVVAGLAGAFNFTGRRLLVPAALAAAALAAMTAVRSRVYRSERALWLDTVAKQPVNARAHYNLARALADAGEVDGALHHYTAALQIRPEFPSAQANLADLLLQRGDSAGAQRHAAAALRLKPDLPEAHNALAGAFLLDGHIDDALREYGIAVKLRPADPDMRNNYGTALSRANRMPEALREYEAALRQSPDSPLLHFNLANTLARLGQFDRAAGEYEATLRLAPNYPRAADNLARVRMLQSTARGSRPPAP